MAPPATDLPLWSPHIECCTCFFWGGRLYSQRLHTAIATLVDTDLVVKQLCDAIAVSGPGTASGTGSFFARDFQLATALVLQVCA